MLASLDQIRALAQCWRALKLLGHSAPVAFLGGSAQRKGSMVQVSISSPKPLFTLSPASLLGGLSSPPPQRQRWHRPLEVTRKPRSSAEVSIEADHVLVSSLLTLGTTMPSHAPWTAATEISQELDLSPLNKGKGWCIRRDTATREKKNCWRRQETICTSPSSPLHLRVMAEKNGTKNMTFKKTYQ